MTSSDLSITTWLYEIRVRGHLDEQRHVWFDGMVVRPLPGEETVVWGVVQDQSALFGLLSRVRDLGLELISVRRIER